MSNDYAKQIQDAIQKKIAEEARKEGLKVEVKSNGNLNVSGDEKKVQAFLQKHKK